MSDVDDFSPFTALRIEVLKIYPAIYFPLAAKCFTVPVCTSELAIFKHNKNAFSVNIDFLQVPTFSHPGDLHCSALVYSSHKKFIVIFPNVPLSSACALAERCFNNQAASAFASRNEKFYEQVW
jgi:hypothetical protein